jgi:hypothetical protein
MIPSLDRRSRALRAPLPWLLLLVTGVAGLCCSPAAKLPGAPRPISASSGAGGAPGDGSGGDPALGGSSSVSSGVDGGDDASTGAGGAIVAPPCPPGDAWGVGAIVSAATSLEGASTAAITPDELSLAWVEPIPGGSMIQITDRANVASTFATAQSIVDSDLDPSLGIALSPDGLRLVTLRSNGFGFVEYTRKERSQPLGQPSSEPFAQINALAGLTPDLVFADPVLSADDGAFLYSRFSSDPGSTIVESRRADLGAWPVGSAIKGDMLARSGGERCRPTGLSADQLSLFYRDATTGHLRVASRAAVASAFSVAADVNAGTGAQPNASCSRLYYTATQSGTTGVWVSGVK